MKTIDLICRRLHDIGIFFLGVAAVVITTYYIRTHVLLNEQKVQADSQFAARVQKITDWQAAHPDTVPTPNDLK
jgi:hypothetical protein